MNIGIIGLGNMGRAFYELFLKDGHDLFVACPHERDIDTFQTRNNAEIVDKSDIIFLAVKPNKVAEVMEEISGKIEGQIIVSMAAGVSVEQLQEMAPTEKIIRILPNTPIKVGEGVVVYTPGYAMSAEEKREFEALLDPAGLVMEMDEKNLDIVTALTGATPAFVAMIVEGFSDGACKCGMKRADTYKLAAAAVAGSCEQLLQEKLHPGELKDMVTSPGGATIEGVLALEEAGVRHACAQSIIKTVEKGKSLS
ncbi:MAG: pyrroline-5-carboxylate reductase [Peptoniphilus sp.]|nr:pyrroline-5-carboxylate reductase [Peptoniphilus sp.]MDD7363481.1 pyrroline-5-carboxylate reductase [Bacillota bacterium]MDY6044815.1 pyrroline-5-carboxylate reductase [Peptoniphilus sp.]